MGYLSEAGEKFITKIEEIHADPRYITVWTQYLIHGGKYDGPSYEQELRALKQALKWEQEDEHTRTTAP